MKMTGAIRKQLSAFLEGFYNIIPRRLISIFNEQELELLVSGLPVIDIDDLKANTEYHKYQANSLQIIWFWRALRSFDQTDKAKFMQFVTGSSKVKKWNEKNISQSILTQVKVNIDVPLSHLQLIADVSHYICKSTF